PIVNLLAKHGLQRKIISNNNKIARKMNQKFSKLEGSELSWDCNTMHIKCFCHNMALVVNSGLKELGLEAPPPPKLKKAFLGSFPYSNHLKPILQDYQDVKRIWLKKTMMMTLARSKTKEEIILIFLQVKHPENRRILPQTGKKSLSNTSTKKLYFTIGLCFQKDHWLHCMAKGLETTCKCNRR
ncbi:hypothetical protein VP01_2968g2, partial [Puccinia sorghi]